MALTIYCYSGCGTCKKALKWLDAEGIAYDLRPIRDTPPSTAELQQVLDALDGAVKRLFNTSSKDYREAGLKDRVADLTPAEAFALLQANGNLVKRPFVVTADGGTVGFKPDQWAELLSK